MNVEESFSYSDGPPSKITTYIYDAAGRLLEIREGNCTAISQNPSDSDEDQPPEQPDEPHICG